MATEADINETYNYMDALFRLSFGEYADCSAAMYDLDFAKTLEEAQRAKHEHILADLCRNGSQTSNSKFRQSTMSLRKRKRHR